MTVDLTNGLLKQELGLASTGKVARKLLVVNLMPNKLATERQFYNLLVATNQDVSVTFARMASHVSHGTPETVLQNAYVTLADIYKQHFDGLIITGAPLETIAFSQVDFWLEFQELLAWRLDHVTETLAECWAAQAALYVDTGVHKQVTDHKVFGVFHSQVLAQNRLTEGLETLTMPQSRHATLPAVKDTAATTFAEDAQAGPIVLYHNSHHTLYISGHPEYDTETLGQEFARDLKRGRAVSLPKNYFAAARPVNTWRSDSVKLYQNWLALMTQPSLSRL